MIGIKYFISRIKDKKILYTYALNFRNTNQTLNQITPLKYIRNNIS